MINSFDELKALWNTPKSKVLSSGRMDSRYKEYPIFIRGNKNYCSKSGSRFSINFRADFFIKGYECFPNRLNYCFDEQSNFLYFWPSDEKESIHGTSQVHTNKNGCHSIDITLPINFGEEFKSKYPKGKGYCWVADTFADSVYHVELK